MEYEIKPVRIRDHYTVISDMMRGLHESEKQLFNKTDDWDVICNNYMKHVMEMQDDYQGTCLVGYVAGQPAGFILGYEEEEDESRIEAYEGKDLYVSDGFVYPEYRRIGLYRAMNKMLEEIYIERGVRRILRYTLTSNLRMQRFLEQEQFQPVRLLYEKWLTPDGKGVVPLKLSSGDGGK